MSASNVAAWGGALASNVWKPPDFQIALLPQQRFRRRMAGRSSQRMGKHGIGKFYGQEKNITT